MARPPRPPSSRRTRNRRAGTARPAAAQTGRSERAHLYRAFFEEANDVFVVFDTNGVMLMVNPEVERLLGYRPEELEGQHYDTVLAPGAEHTLTTRSQHLVAKQPVPQVFEIALVRKDGTHVHVEARVRTRRDEAKQVIGYLGIFRNITERKHSEAARQEREDQYRTLVETIKDVVYVLDSEVPMLRQVNPAFETITGWSTAEWLHREDVFQEIIHVDDLLPTMDLYRRAQQGEVLPRFEIRIRGKDGVYRIGEFSASPRLRDGKVVEIVGVARDITERKNEQHQLEEHRRLLAQIAEAIPQVLYLFDLGTQRVRFVNTRVTACLGYTPEQLCAMDGPTLRALTHPEDVTQLGEWDTRFASVTDGEVVEREYRVRHTNGAYRWLQSRETVCTRLPDGTPEQILGIAQDVSQHKQLAALMQGSTITHKNVGAQLQKFREGLKMTQPEFGAYFGGYNQRQISTYEVGKVEVPLALLLNIRAKGFPLEAILGKSPTAVLERTATYFSAMQGKRFIAQQLAAALAAVLTQDVAVINHAVAELHVPVRELDTGEQHLLEQLMKFQKEEP